MATTKPRIGSPIAGLLKLTQGQRVKAHQRQYRATQRHECDVEHDRLLAGAASSVGPRKLSIANWASAHKDLVSFGQAARGREPMRARQLLRDRISAG